MCTAWMWRLTCDAPIRSMLQLGVCVRRCIGNKYMDRLRLHNDFSVNQKLEFCALFCPLELTHKCWNQLGFNQSLLPPVMGWIQDINAIGQNSAQISSCQDYLPTNRVRKISSHDNSTRFFHSSSKMSGKLLPTDGAPDCKTLCDSRLLFFCTFLSLNYDQ